MKRLAVLALAAGMFGATGRAADPLPLPTGFAPTAPRVPAPTVRGGAVVPVAATSAPAAGAVQLVGFGGVRPTSDWGRGPQVWCNDCAPAVRHPLPPVPDAAGCAGAACAPAPLVRDHDGSCLAKVKEWFCFRQTPVHLGLTPTPRMAPFYTYFPCTEKAGCAAGNCGPGGCAAGHPRLGAGLFGGAKGCTTCPQPGEAVMPGFRFAAPSAGAPTYAPAPVAEVIQSNFRVPTGPQPTVPYRQPASR